MKNTLGDLHNILLGRIEKLSDDSLTGDELRAEIERSGAIQKLAGTVIGNANLILKAQQYAAEAGQIAPAEGWKPLLPGTEEQARTGKRMLYGPSVRANGAPKEG